VEAFRDLWDLSRCGKMALEARRGMRRVNDRMRLSTQISAGEGASDRRRFPGDRRPTNRGREVRHRDSGT
jgi:hypothetical protein